MPRKFPTVRHLVYWEYAKLIAGQAVGDRKNYRFVNHAYKRLLHDGMNASSILRENQQLFLAGEVCAYCGCKDALQWEHIIPLADGGPNTIDNLVRACSKCNLAKGKQDPYQWYSGGRTDTIPRLVLGKYLKLIYDAYEARELLDSQEFMENHQVERISLGKVFALNPRATRGVA